MKTHTHVLAAGALALALFAPAISNAATTVLDEGFDDISTLTGWSQFNDGFFHGDGWFQGNTGVFAAQSGPASSYIATDFANRTSSIDAWLITPVLDLTGTTELSFFARSRSTWRYQDAIEVRFEDSPGTFNTVLGLWGVSGGTAPNRWTSFSETVNLEGSGRLAFRYTSNNSVDYVGFDSIRVVTAVPEPSSWLMLALGLAGVAAVRRKFN